MKQITQLGATVEEAISLALQQLNTTRENVEVEVLQEAKKGFLGFGARQAKVFVSLKIGQAEESSSIQVIEEEMTTSQNDIPVSLEKTIETEEVQTSKVVSEFSTDEQEDPIQITKDYLISIANDMGVTDLKIETNLLGKNVYFKLESEKAALLIGKRGATLNALQQLAQLVLNKSAKSFLLVKLDVENYRERRQIALEQLAERMADKAIRTGKKVSLEPMPSYERKVIHNALANRIDIETYSEGTEPNRYLVIESIK